MEFMTRYIIVNNLKFSIYLLRLILYLEHRFINHYCCYYLRVINSTNTNFHFSKIKIFVDNYVHL